MLYTSDKVNNQSMISSESNNSSTSLPKIGEVIYKKYLTKELAILRVKPKEGKVPDFKAGQFVSLGFDLLQDKRLTYRAYSIASPPEEKRYFEFYIKLVNEPIPGKVSSSLFNLKEKDLVYWRYPAGSFTIEDKKVDGSIDSRRLILVASGTGLAPFISYVLHLLNTGKTREIILLHGAKNAAELGYKDLLKGLELRKQHNWNFKYIATVSRPDHPLSTGWNGHIGRVESLFVIENSGLSKLEKILETSITPENSFFHICGYQGTISSVIKSLTPLGFVTNKNRRQDGSFDIKIETYD
jgi:ferredoxin--NADP+ reductase